MLTRSDEAGGEDHYADFLATLRFLQADETRTTRCAAILKEYRSELLRLGSTASGRVRELKDQLEDELRRVMVRTERLAATVDRDGMLWQVPVPPLTVTADDAMTYLSRLGPCGGPSRPAGTLEYWKSSPYLLSFMEDYQRSVPFRATQRTRLGLGVMAGVLRDHRLLTVPWKRSKRTSGWIPGTLECGG
jgi:hypothetical protein